MTARLLAGTALALATLGVPGALASDRLQLGLSGNFRIFGVAGSLADGRDAASPTGMEVGAGLRRHGVAREGEVHFRGSVVLDNGIEVGTRVELEAETSFDQVDHSYVFFDGAFGRLELGSAWGPGVTMFYGGAGDVIPGHGNFAAMQQAPMQTWGFGGGYFATYNYRLDNANDKIVYYTPRFGGLQIGLAYTPDDKGARSIIADPTSGLAEESGGGFNMTDNGGQSETKTLAANYLRRIGPVDLALFGSYSAADAEPAGGEDSSAWGFGGQFAYAGFAAGGSFLRIRDIGGLAGRDRDEWEVGGSYATGPWTIGLAYAHIDQDGNPMTTFGDDTADYLAVGVTYAIGPGITLGGGVQYYDYQSGTAPGGLKSAPDGQHTILLFGTAVSF